MPKPKKPSTHEAPLPQTEAAPPNEPDKSAVALTPWAILQDALKALPALKYTLGVLGIVSAIAIIKGFGIDFRAAVFGTIIMMVLMTALVVFAALSKVKSPQIRAAALVMMWSFLAITILSSGLLFTSVWFDFPKSLPEILWLATPLPEPSTAGNDPFPTISEFQPSDLPKGLLDKEWKEWDGKSVVWQARVSEAQPKGSDEMRLRVVSDDIIIDAYFLTPQSLAEARKLSVNSIIILQGVIRMPYEEGRERLAVRLIKCKFWPFKS